MTERAAPDAGEVEEVAHLSLLIGRLLLLNGADTAQVEAAVARFAAGFGCEAHLMVSYETLLLTIVAGDHFRTKIGSRVPAMNVGMTVVAAVNRLVDDVERGRCGLAQARAALDAVEHRPPEYGRWLVVGALGLTAASLSRLFGGDWPTFAIDLARRRRRDMAASGIGQAPAQPDRDPVRRRMPQRPDRRRRRAAGRRPRRRRCAWWRPA